MIENIKIIAGVLVLVGVIVGYINIKYAPQAILFESSPDRPAWLPWLGWLITSISAALYIVVDYIGS